MTKQTPEGAVKAAVKRRLEEHNILPFTKAADVHSDGFYWMPVQGPFAVHGVHDIVGVYLGRFFSLETKAPDNKVDATGPQAAFREASHHAGGFSYTGVRDAMVVDVMVRHIQASNP